MFDRINSIIRRTGLALVAKTTSPVADGTAGLWNSSGKLLWRLSGGQDVGLVRGEGVIPSARCAFSANPSDADTLGIGTHTFTFKTTLAAAGATTQVKILGSAALTLAALLDAINGVTNANVVQATTPFSASIVADAVSATVLRIRKADEQGGTAIAGTVSSTALAASITAGASAWSAADLNVTGKSASDAKASFFQFAVTAAMVTNGSFQVELPFTPTAFSAFVTSSAGVQRASTDAVTISGNAISVALAGGASPAIQAGDLVRVWAIE